jgi:hypothetical protein
MKATTRKPRRVTQDQLERLSEVHQVDIEFDNTTDPPVGVLTLERPHREFYATLAVAR